MMTPTGDVLCARCDLASTCRIPGESGEDILTCEAFRSMREVFRSPKGGKSSITMPDSSRIEGLCGDCGNRGGCVFRQREGGTWHCEEYG